MIDPSTLVPAPMESALEPFSETSRYRGLPLLTGRDAAGREVTYVGRRWVPPPQMFAVAGKYPVREGDRVDLVAATQMGNPLLWWRLADANGALAPAELTAQPGVWLRIPLPPGFGGGSR